MNGDHMGAHCVFFKSRDAIAARLTTNRAHTTTRMGAGMDAGMGLRNPGATGETARAHT